MKVEIARSFSFKLNAGNYESRDFFCSQKAEVEDSYAEETSDKLYEFCKKAVMKSVNAYLEEMKLAKLPRGKSKVEREEDAKTSAELSEADI